MAQALSEEEFHRMQAQLLELRTQNYQLSDELRKNTAELNSVRQKTSNLEKDYVKAQKVVAFFGFSEVDALLNENKMLQGKLHSQEDDFRLQNSTLMQELSKLCSQIEQLELENRRLREGQGLERPASGPVDAELLRLQAENSALQKKLKGERSSYIKSSSVFPHKQFRIRIKGIVYYPFKKWSLYASLYSFQRLQVEKEALYNDSRTKIDEIQQRKEEELKSINLRVQKLQTDLMAANQNVAELKEQLQSKQKEHEMAIHALKDQVACQSAVSQEQVEGMLSENDALRTNLAALEQIQTVKTQEQNLLREQNLMLNAELQQKRTELESFLAQRDDLNSQLQESNRANSRLLEQLTELGLEKDKLQQELEEARKTADKRKVMLDELAIETAQEKSRHKEELSDVRLQHEKEVLSIRARYEKELRGLHEEKNRMEEEIRSQLRDERARTKELEGLQPYVEELKAQVQSMEGTKGCFERRLKEAEVPCVHNHLSLQSTGRDGNLWLKCPNTILVYSLLNVLQTKCPSDVQIMAVMLCLQLKDLKRQLHLERKRADKLQERLQEILTNTKTRTGLEELVLSEISSPSHTQQTGDSSSISSFSYREIMKDGASAPSTNKSNTSSPQSQRPADLSDDEVSELFQRLAEVQQEKWILMLLGKVELSWNSPGLQYCTKPSPGQFCCVLHRGL
uniref:GRIP1-associated protein 1-like n=1 Tax=Sinocyclocheilus rhinocerous TaxID=307959 RepID=A0A673MAQ0_9TELE